MNVILYIVVGRDYSQINPKGPTYIYIYIMCACVYTWFHGVQGHSSRMLNPRPCDCAVNLQSYNQKPPQRIRHPRFKV